jgi:hypothetical protein
VIPKKWLDYGSSNRGCVGSHFGGTRQTEVIELFPVAKRCIVTDFVINMARDDRGVLAGYFQVVACEE